MKLHFPTRRRSGWRKHCMLELLNGSRTLFTTTVAFMFASPEFVFSFFPLLTPTFALLHCGRAFKMAFTSSATAVRANSNWSWAGEKREEIRKIPHVKCVQTAPALMDGTLVRTRPGLWSLMCSSVAAMSISLTPVNMKPDKVDINAKRRSKALV